MNIRSVTFSLVDKLTGNQINSNMKYLKNNTIFSEEKLKSLLVYAQENIDFYRKYNSNRLVDFPVVDKETINIHRKKFENQQIPTYHVMKTSGTTGEPLISKQDKAKRKSTIASLIHYNKMSGVNLGEKYLYVKSFSEKTPNLTESLKLRAKNEVRMDIDEISDETMENFLHLLDIGDIKSVIGYAAFYDFLTSYVLKNNITKDYKGINFITTSSVLPKESKYELEKRLSISIHDRYANQEIGILAHTLGNELFHVSPQVVMEVIDPVHNRPVSPGEMGRIVVTDLFNYKMPFIRYDTGDYGIVQEYNSYGFVKTLKEISGRKVSMIPVGQGYVTSHAISVYMRELGIDQWQVVVKGNIVILNIQSKLENKIKLAKKGLSDLLPTYRIVVSANTPKTIVQGKSGKRELIVHDK